MPAAPRRPRPLPEPDSSTTPSALTTLTWAVRILAAEAGVLCLLVIFLVYQDVVGTPASTGSAIGLTLFVALLAGLLGGFAWALTGRRSWARGPAIVLQLLLLPIGYTMATGGLSWVGLVVMAVGLCGAGTLLAPATRAALGMR